MIVTSRSRWVFAAALAMVALPAATEPAIPPVASLSDGVWMKGDLHIHSRHSTDSSNNSEATIIGFAEQAGFDFLGITDHDNHVNGDVAHHTWSDPEFRSDKLVLLYGAEWTTNRGHGNVFSARLYDHQALFDIRDARDAKILALKRKLGVHLSANHPSGKDHFGFSFDMVDSIEVWNSVLWPRNVEALMIWDDMLRTGRKITGRGGSDSHHGTPPSPDKATKNSMERTANYVGTPTTWVFATAKTPEAVVAALDNGRVSISASPYGPRVELTADRDGDGRADMMMGDNVKASGKPVRFEVRLVGGKLADATYIVRVIRNGEKFAEYPASGAGPVVRFADTPPAGERSYYRVEVEGPQTPYPQVPNAAGVAGKMVALSNPVFFNFDPTF
ncbi:CehA/McbA family metallohydrolase [Sphingomonas aracearum]|uniref:Histidinol-phosphatase n=1 Tax=Sphingomonas aracearum TaxID=2283317 RepID=A0A369VXA0_9SPHN|nr:CehA/McbA family metallohydrolase [Sphingomonas aracearum]RDE05702.1 histidinol-phosphatase [Sphingomonas aracearum]